MKHKPEIFIGLVGPIGCDITEVGEVLSHALEGVKYKSEFITLSKLMPDIYKRIKDETDTHQETDTLDGKISLGNKICEKHKARCVFAAYAINEIYHIRSEINEKEFLENPKKFLKAVQGYVANQKIFLKAIRNSVKCKKVFSKIQKDVLETPKEFIKSPEKLKKNSKKMKEIQKCLDFRELPAEGTAYIIKQFKRPEEIDLMRKVYGKNFIQVSITQDVSGRLSNLTQKIGEENKLQSNKENKFNAQKLIDRDSDEIENEFGQRLSKIFYLGDVFIDASNKETIQNECSRFVNALFGKNNIAPKRDEFGSFLATVASQRSTDLSRQVGAAILSDDGDLITIGCNEVPKPGGGNYWGDDINKYRDIDKGFDSNKKEGDRIIIDLLDRLQKAKVLISDIDSSDFLNDERIKKSLTGAKIKEITEYGRMVHAEMNALIDAARLGRSVKDATLYTTTFPCHNCAKHIIASGISRVVFIEPYQKSKTEELYEDTILIEENKTKSEEGKIIFTHFSGIAPERFFDIFHKKKRVDKDGVVQKWYQGEFSPRIGDSEAGYTNNEFYAVKENLPHLSIY